MSLPEMHEHMIRSPPPTNWPKSPNFKVFHFPHNEDETISVEVNVSTSGLKKYFNNKMIYWQFKNLF